MNTAEISTDADLPEAPPRTGMAAGKLAMWFYIASEVMLFAGLLGSYVVLRSSDPDVFSHEQSGGERLLAVMAALTLIGGTATLSWAARQARRGESFSRISRWLVATLLCGFAFCGIVAARPIEDSRHQTILTADLADNRIDIYDGMRTAASPASVTLRGYHAIADETLDIHRVTGDNLREMATQQGSDATEQTFELPRSTITQTISYGPWKNDYFACFDLMLGMIAIHVVGGLIIICTLMRRSVTVVAIECARLYWAFFAVVWLLMLPLLYWS